MRISIIKVGLFILFFSTNYFCRSQQDEEVKELLRQVKEASYFDSLRLFSLVGEVEKKLQAKNEPAAIAKLKLYCGNYFFYVHKLEKAKRYFEIASEEAKKYNDPQLEALASVRLAYVEMENGNYDKAEKEMKQLLEKVRKARDPENTAEILNILGIIIEQKNETQEAVKLYLEGINVAELNKLDYYTGVFRNNLGRIKYFSGQVEESLVDYFKGLECANRDNNPRLANHIKMNICVAYVNQKKFEKAADLFTEVTSYSRENNLPLELASVYVNLGSSFSSVGKPETAMQYIDSGIYVLRKHGLLYALERAYLGKCDALIAMGKTAEALVALDSVKALNKITKDLEDASYYYLMLYRISSANKDHKEALENYLEYTRLKDSLGHIMNEKVLGELEVKYLVQKKEIELERERSKTLELEKSNQEERFMKRMVMAGGGALFVLFIFLSLIWYSRKLRAKQEQFSQMLIKDIEEERHRIARDLHDDVGQSLSIIKSRVDKSAKSEGEDLGAELSRVIEQTRQISRGLYPSYLEKIGLTRALAALLEKVQDSSGIQCSFEIDEKVESLSLDVKTHIYRILQECINNTIKHAGANALKVALKYEAGAFFLNYRDNGKGLLDGKGKGLGLQSMRERAKIIGGSISLGNSSDKGFEMHLKFNARV